LLIGAFPPELHAGLAPVRIALPTSRLQMSAHADKQRLIVPPGEHMGFLFLGSDGEIRFKTISPLSGMRKYGSLKYQHGDAVGIKAGEWGVEVLLKPDGFGFGQFSYQAYTYCHHCVSFTGG
jgi:hypothetical protein